MSEIAARCARLALDAVHRAYPYHATVVMNSAADARPPRDLTPVFFGCFDWHSAVHGHWTLVRLVRLYPDASFAGEARAALGRSFTEDGVAGELAFLSAPGRQSFERPYGLAWLLQLCAELREWETATGAPDEAGVWRALFADLETLAIGRMRDWLPKLVAPIRSGEHSQSAFALGLVLDWARTAGDRAAVNLVCERAAAFHGHDRAAPIAYEPSGHDFLSPVLAEADLMRRVYERSKFAGWLDRFLPALDSAAARRWLEPVRSPDPADGKLSHLDGLNLSRAWMLEGIAEALPQGPARVALEAAAATHAWHGLRAVSGEHYAGAHWLGTFATYLVTRRGMMPSSVARGGAGSRS